MKSIDLLERFDKSNGAVGFIATYDFDPQFFERRILTKKSFGSAERVVVFMDRTRYQELLDNGLAVPGFNRRYLVVPIGRTPYVFHPKLYLTLGNKGAEALIGSSNCTSAGIGHNLELCSGFSVSEGAAKSDEQQQRTIIRNVYEAMKAFAADAGSLRELIDTQFFRLAESLYPWLDSRVSVPPGDLTFLHSHEAPLWKQLISHLDKERVRKITIISPFYDRDLGFIKQVREQWPKANLTIVAQPQYATLAGEKLAEVFIGGKHELLAAAPPQGRRLHAKAFAFETGAGTYWFTGSANATRAAFNGRNTEAGFLLKTEEGAEFLLKESGLKLRRLDPRKFQAGHDDEPASKFLPRPVALHSAVLESDGTLVCKVDVASDINALTLRLRNYNELLPVLSVHLRRRKGDTVSVELSETQIEQIRATAICEIRGVSDSGKEVVSNGVALVQINHLLRERPGLYGGGNPLRQIEETGENLVSHVETLGSVREAVEFFNNCSIRFFDGEDSGRGSKGTFWRPRDPFKPDAPPSWLNIRLGGSPADLRAAIEDFVERHQSEKLYRHVRRANLNGLSNFLDIFRTLNGLLFAYHSRTAPKVGPIIPFGVVTHYVMMNVELLIGPYEAREDAYEGNGFISAVYSNFAGDRAIVRERLKDEHVPQMLCAAMEAMLRVRAKARRMDGLDDWAARRVRWITSWIKAQRQPEPKREDIEAAGLEYSRAKRAA